MMGRTGAITIAFGGLILAVLAGAFLPLWTRSLLVGAISGGAGVFVLRAMSPDEDVDFFKGIPRMAAYGIAVGIMAALGTWLGTPS